MARVIAHAVASSPHIDVLVALRLLFAATCGLALILAGQPLPF